MDYRLVIKDGKFIEKNRTQIQLQYTFLIDSTKQPKTIDLLVGENDDGRRNLGVYELLGNDLLVICQSFPGLPRPSEFETTPNSKRYLTIYQRVKETSTGKLLFGASPRGNTKPDARATRARVEEEGPKTDKDLLQGTWLVESTVIDGKDVPKDQLQASRITFGDDYVVTTSRSGVATTSSYKIDPETKPKSLDIIKEGGNEGGKTIRLIYKLDADTLTLCEPGAWGQSMAQARRKRAERRPVLRQESARPGPLGNGPHRPVRLQNRLR